MMRKKRKQLYVDPQVQGPIVRRVVVYWVACLGFMILPVLLARVVVDPKVFVLHHVPGIIARYWPIFVCMTLMLPLAILDALTLSNRFAGPVFRIRNELRKYNQGEGTAKLELRREDFWHDLADEFNTLTERTQNTHRVEADRQATDADLVCAEDCAIPFQKT